MYSHYYICAWWDDGDFLMLYIHTALSLAELQAGVTTCMYGCVCTRG